MAIRKATQAQVDRARKMASKAAWEDIIATMKTEKSRAPTRAKKYAWQAAIMEARKQAGEGTMPGSGKYGGVKTPTGAK